MYFSNVLEHYVLLALRKSGASIDDDVRAELNGATADLEATIASLEAKIVRLEKRITQLEQTAAQRRYRTTAAQRGGGVGKDR